MPITPDFDDNPRLQEAFMSFRSATLPPASHTSAQAHATVRRRRRVRIGVAAAAVALLLGGPGVAMVVLRGSGSPDQPPASPSPAAPTSVSTTPPAPSVTSPAPTTDPAASTSDLTLAASIVNVRGSAGTAPGDALVAIRNNGPDPLDQIDLTFTIPSWMETTGPAWDGCRIDAAAATTTCSLPAPLVGATRVYTLGFLVDFTHSTPSPLMVTTAPHGGTDPNPVDNTRAYGASGQGGFDTGLSAGRLTTEGTRGTVSIDLTNRGQVVGYFTVTFSYSPAVRPDPASFVGCLDDQASQTIQCQVLGPESGGTTSYTYEFNVDLGLSAPELSVTAWPYDAETDNSPNDNQAVIEV